MKQAKFIPLFLFMVILGILAVDLTVQAGILNFFYSTKDELNIAGNKIFYNNQPIIIKGLAVGDPYSREVIYSRTVDDYKTIKNDWLGNAVRLSYYPGDFREKGDEAEAVFERQVKFARDQGLIVIVDWHAIGFPDGWFETQAGDNSHYYYSSDFNYTKDFWKYMAIKYRSDRGVIFELWNEPTDKTRSISWQDIKPYLQRLYDIIRSNGAENIVIASGVSWTYDLRGIKDNPLKGDNISYAWHSYPGSDKLLSWDQATNGLDSYYPLIITEWGFNTSSVSKDHHKTTLDDYPQRIKSFILENNLNFTAWCWQAFWQPNMLERNWSDLTDYGRFTKDLLYEMETIEDTKTKINNFIGSGVDYNSIYLGRGERQAVIYSFKQAFGRQAATYKDYNDILKIVNGRWPVQRSKLAEDKAKNNFKFIYKREANLNNLYDNAAITVMAYGLRQKSYNRNLNSERQALGIFGRIFAKMPDTTEEWNILQAITYSGATR
ncbi:MAG: glycoside hydrolase family 5 protein [Patescibacteria group bacterium]